MSEYPTMTHSQALTESSLDEQWDEYEDRDDDYPHYEEASDFVDEGSLDGFPYYQRRW